MRGHLRTKYGHFIIEAYFPSLNIMKPPKIIPIHGKTQNNSFRNNQISSETKTLNYYPMEH